MQPALPCPQVLVHVNVLMVLSMALDFDQQQSDQFCHDNNTISGDNSNILE